MTLLPGFPAKMQGLDVLGAPIITDVSGTGATAIVNSADSSAVQGYASGGGQATGFPKFFTGWSLWSPTAGDLLTTGKNDLVMMSREGYLFAWSTPGLASANSEWWHSDHDERNTGTYRVDSRPPGVIRNLVCAAHAPTATFSAPGDDWYSGKVASYRVTFQPSGTTVAIAPTGAAGTKQVVAVPAGTTRFVVRAVDDAGNLGPVRVVT
jgi:hypothetical protein